MKFIRILLWIVTNHLVQTFSSSSHDCACPPGSYIRYRSSDGIYRCPPPVREIQSWAECKAIGEKCTNPIVTSEAHFEYILHKANIFKVDGCIPGDFVKSYAGSSIFTCPEAPSRINNWSECEALGTSCTNPIVLDDTCNFTSCTVRKSTGVFSNYVEKLRAPTLKEIDVLEKPSTKKCALLFFGLAKHFNDIVYPSIKKYILNVNPNCDVYAHTYDIKVITNPRNEEDRTPINPLEVYSMTHNVVLDTLESVSEKIDFDCYHKHYYQTGGLYPYSMDNSLKQWFSIQRVWDSMPSKYERIGLFRLDVLYTEPIDIQNGDAVIPDFHHHRGLNDRAFYGLYKWARHWATNRLKKLAIRSEQDNVYNMQSEGLVKYLLRDVPVELKPICFHRVRATGKIMNDCKPTPSSSKTFTKPHKTKTYHSSKWEHFSSSFHNCKCPPGLYIKYRSTDAIYACPSPVNQVESWAECKAIGEKCTNPIVTSEADLKYILQKTNIFKVYGCVPGDFVKSHAGSSIFPCPEAPSRINNWSECEALGTSCTNPIVLDDACNLEHSSP